MPRRPTRTVPTVILHGWQVASPDHWQNWLAGELRSAGREVRFPDLPTPEHPDLGSWLAALWDTLAGLPDDGFDVVCHSLGSVLWLHHATQRASTPKPSRVALVAPPSPSLGTIELASFFPPPVDVDAVRGAADGTVLVGGDADPQCPEGIADAYGRPLKMATTVIPGGAHLNVESGFGQWPAVLDWCGRDNLAFIA
ncbi:MAG TPA: alpha/beta hydrolase [Jatrophihabitantaceae bacterium]|nr:alpha/beta hydrolase [Jatrophihabitantaceae bacterium]